MPSFAWPNSHFNYLRLQTSFSFKWYSLKYVFSAQVSDQLIFSLFVCSRGEFFYYKKRKKNTYVIVTLIIEDF